MCSNLFRDPSLQVADSPDIGRRDLPELVLKYKKRTCLPTLLFTTLFLSAFFFVLEEFLDAETFITIFYACVAGIFILVFSIFIGLLFLLNLYRLLTPIPLLVINTDGLLIDRFVCGFFDFNRLSLPWSAISKIGISTDGKESHLSITCTQLDPNNKIDIDATLLQVSLDYVLDFVNIYHTTTDTVKISSNVIVNDNTCEILKNTVATRKYNRKGGTMLVIIGYCMVLLAMLLVCTVPYTTWYTFEQTAGGELFDDAFRVGLYILTGLGGYSVLHGRQLRIPSAEEVLQSDCRKPVLYLRSFNDDESEPKGALPADWCITKSNEEALASIFNKVGPFVAVGRPGETISVLGAYRKYVSEEKWRDVVLSFLKDAIFVIFRLGTSGAGIYWELSSALQHCDVSRILLYFPYEIWSDSWGDRLLGNGTYKQRYELFKKDMHKWLPDVRFPDDITYSEFWMFDNDLRLIPLNSSLRGVWGYIKRLIRGCRGPYFCTALAPFFERSGLPRVDA